MKKIVQIIGFLSICYLKGGAFGSSDFGSGGFVTQTGNGQSSGQVTWSTNPVGQLTNIQFQLTDWQNILLSIFQKYSASGLTTWYYQGKNALPDSELTGFLNRVQRAVGPQSDQATSLYRSQAASHVSFNPKTFLTEQGSQILSSERPTGWFYSFPSSKSIPTESLFQSGFANTITQYAAVAIENFMARAAIGASLFTTASGQTNGGLLGQKNSQIGPFMLSNVSHSNEPQIVTDFINTAQWGNQMARYFRLMNLYPQNVSSQLNETSTNSFSDNFVIPTNSADANFGNNGSPALNPMNTFCGVIVINGIPGNNIVQVGSQGGSWGPATHTNPEYAPVFFLPATAPTMSPNSNQVAPYNSYAPVDAPFNTYTGSDSAGIVERSVSFNFATAVTIAGYTVDQSNPVVVTVSNQPAAGDSSGNGLYINLVQPPNTLTAGGGIDAQFNSYDLQNFFAIPSQWAIVVKVTPSGATVLGIVKLNPYDFPLNFTTSAMQSTLGITSSSVTSAPPQTFSQKDIWDAPKNLYGMTAPQGKPLDYSFAYLVLRGLFNGYLFSNTYSAFFNTTEWPLNTDSTAYRNYYGLSSFIPGSKEHKCLLLDQVFPTPLLDSWIGTSSPLDWFYLRLFIAFRHVLQSIYCPYDALISLVNQMEIVSGPTQQGALSYVSCNGEQISTQGMSVIEYLMYNPNVTFVIRTSFVPHAWGTRLIIGQNYVLGGQAPATQPAMSPASTSYLWILPAISQPSSTITTNIATGNENGD